MPREITIPASTIKEDIYLIEESVGVSVRVHGYLAAKTSPDLS
jgi:hypothetical protein